MITAVVLVKNEEANIVDCLESLSFCDERLVIDDDSTDRSFEVAKLRGAKVVKHSLEGNFSKQRNFAFTIAQNEWVLFVDADERVSSKLSDEIRRAVRENKKDGYYIPRKDKLFGKELTHGELAGKKFLRLGKRNKGKWIGAVHEEWRIQGSVGTLHNFLLHTPHQTLSEFIAKINFYTTLRAEELHKENVQASWFSIILYTKGKFFYTYILKMGFLDGVAGLVMSLMMTMHSFLTRSKLYLLTHKATT